MIRAGLLSLLCAAAAQGCAAGGTSLVDGMVDRGPGQDAPPIRDDGGSDLPAAQTDLPGGQTDLPVNPTPDQRVVDLPHSAADLPTAPDKAGPDLKPQADQKVPLLDQKAPDQKVPDQKVPDTGPPLAALGEGCTSASDCHPSAPLCVTASSSKGVRVCSKACTADDPATPLINEDNCPAGSTCATFTYTTATFYYCLKNCTPSLTVNTCPTSSQQSCDPFSTRFTRTSDKAVCWFPACKTNTDCPVLAAKTCGNNADCASVASDAFCVSGTCARPGNCTAGGLCGPHTLGKGGAKVGDPCTSDFDCAGSGLCLFESTSSGAIGPDYRNGYCSIPNCSFASTLPAFACPTGSSCHKLYFGGLCHRSCQLGSATDCRNHGGDNGGDYECYAWNNLSLMGVQVTTTPVCQSAATITCDSLGTSLDCTDLGTAGNATNMKCRDRFTGVAKTDLKDPGGVCLDDTASGAF
jgi:hypothetical protein